MPNKSRSALLIFIILSKFCNFFFFLLINNNFRNNFYLLLCNWNSMDCGIWYLFKYGILNFMSAFLLNWNNKSSWTSQLNHFIEKQILFPADCDGIFFRNEIHLMYRMNGPSRFKYNERANCMAQLLLLLFILMVVFPRCNDCLDGNVATRARR